jgi:transcriptional regulator with XRE-family HTH domain/NACalpha-BTF3-like transcription factor
MSIGKRILELRTKAGLTQLELAERLYVTDKAVSKWERDAGDPNTQALIEMGKIFSVSIDYLLTGESKEKVVIMSETEKIAFDDDVEKTKKYPYELETGIDVSGLSLRDYIYKHKSKSLFNYFVKSSQAKSLLGDERGDRYKYLNEFVLMCFETENYSSLESAVVKGYSSNQTVIPLVDIYFIDQLPEWERKSKPIINESIVNYIINNEKALNFIMKDQDIYWHNGLSKVLEKLVKDNNSLSDKVYKFVEKKNNQAKKYQESQYNSYYRSNDYWLKKDGVYHTHSNKLVKSITPVTRETVIYALNHNNYELAEKLNELSGGLVSSHEFKMDKVSKDTKISKKDKLKESVIIDGLVDIDKLIALDDYKLYKEVIDQPASKEEAVLQLAEKQKYRELLIIAEEEKLSYTKEAIIRDRITTLKDAIINDFRGKHSDFNKKYLVKEQSYNSKLLGKNGVLFKDIINHKDYDFFRHAVNTDKENLDWALKKIVKDRSKEYKLIKILLDEGAKLHSCWTEDDGWGYVVQRDEIDDVATQLLRNQIVIFLKEENNND